MSLIKKPGYPLLTAVLIAVAIGVPVAHGTAKADRVGALEKKMKTLQSRVVTLESSLAAARRDVAAVRTDADAVRSDVTALQTSVQGLTTSMTCIRYKVMPISRYDGYLYTPDGNHVTVTTALDVPDQGQTPAAYAALVNPSCVGSSALRLASTAHRSPVRAFHTR